MDQNKVNNAALEENHVTAVWGDLCVGSCVTDGDGKNISFGFLTMWSYVGVFRGSNCSLVQGYHSRPHPTMQCCGL